MREMNLEKGSQGEAAIKTTARPMSPANHRSGGEMPRMRPRKNPGDSNLTKIAYANIKSDIISNKIKAGDRLSSCQLAKDMSMSRTPVREALNLLESEGFVDIHNGIGILVKEITEKDIIELFEVRAALECSALESSTFMADPKGLKALERSWLNLQKKYARSEARPINHEEVFLLDYETHDFIVTSSHNSYLIELMHNVSIKVKRIQYLSLLALNDVFRTIEEHLDLLNKLKNDELAESVQLLKKHIINSGAYVYQAYPVSKSESFDVKL